MIDRALSDRNRGAHGRHGGGRTLWGSMAAWSVVGLNAAAGTSALLAILVGGTAPARSWLAAIASRSAAFLYLATCVCTCAVMWTSRPSRGRVCAASIALIGHSVMLAAGIGTVLKDGRAFFAADHVLSQIVTGIAVASLVAIVARLRRPGLREAAVSGAAGSSAS